MSDNTPSDDVAIFLKSWEITQNLAKSNGETAWKIKTWGLTVWSALLAYSFKEKSPEIQIISIVFIITIMIFELSVRRIQYKFIKKSLEIEEAIDSIVTKNKMIKIPEKGISTNIDTPTIADFKELFSLKRWMLWFPYVILISSSIAALAII